MPGAAILGFRLRYANLPVAVVSLSFMVSFHGWKSDQDAATAA
jgi:hypothetical protein